MNENGKFRKLGIAVFVSIVYKYNYNNYKLLLQNLVLYHIVFASFWWLTFRLLLLHFSLPHFSIFLYFLAIWSSKSFKNYTTPKTLASFKYADEKRKAHAKNIIKRTNKWTLKKENKEGKKLESFLFRLPYTFFP